MMDKIERFKLIEQIQALLKKKRNIIPDELLKEIKQKLEEIL
jgi:hypothetical protein